MEARSWKDEQARANFARCRETVLSEKSESELLAFFLLAEGAAAVFLAAVLHDAEPDFAEVEEAGLDFTEELDVVGGVGEGEQLEHAQGVVDGAEGVFEVADGEREIAEVEGVDGHDGVELADVEAGGEFPSEAGVDEGAGALGHEALPNDVDVLVEAARGDEDGVLVDGVGVERFVVGVYRRRGRGGFRRGRRLSGGGGMS